MSITRKNATPGSLVAEMTIDIYANTADNEISVMHGEDFKQPVERLEFDPSLKLLYFIYEDGERQDFGVEIKDSLIAVFLLVENVALFRIDMEKELPIASKLVPLKILDEDSV